MTNESVQPGRAPSNGRRSSRMDQKVPDDPVPDRWNLLRRAPGSRGGAHDQVAAEIAAEQAATLNRIVAALAHAVDQWRRLEARPEADDKLREHALNVVSRAAWHVLVQRDSLGLGGDDRDWLRRHHGVPERALARMGTLEVLVDDPDEGPRDAGIPPLGPVDSWR